MHLKQSRLIPKLNAELAQWETTPDGHTRSYPESGRPAKRHGIYLADDDFGLLIEDMRPGTHPLPLFDVPHI